MIKKTILAAILLLGANALAQQNCIFLESDVYPGSYGSLPVSITEYNGALYFRCTGSSAGPELWKHENGVSSIVEDLMPGAGGSMPNQLTVMGSDLYFTAFTSTTGTELFKYDGVSISLVADINPGSTSSNVNFLTAIGSELYFTADDGVNGNEPWKYDGTTATLVADVNPGPNPSNPDEFAGAGGYIYFTGYNDSYGFELWKYDGTTATVNDIYPGVDGSDLGELTPIGSKICFRATNGVQGYELFTHDGTTLTCLDVCQVGPGDFTPWSFVKFGSEVFFRGFIQDTGYELWKYDGTSASLVADIQPGPGNAHPNHFTAGDTKLYFFANDGATGNELWMYDGTTTSLVSDIYPGSTESLPHGSNDVFTTYGDDLLFIADNGTAGKELWRYDGTDLYIGEDIVPGSGSSLPSELMMFGSSLYFMADDQNAGGELWVWHLEQDLDDSISVVTCGDYTSPGGTVYSGLGTYDFVDVIPSVFCPGCDSTITVHLNIVNPQDSIVVLTCDTYYSPGGTVYSVPDNYVFTDTISSILCPGVDSIITVDLTIVSNFSASITTFSGIVFVSQAGAEYQWLDCDNGMAPIPGETEQDFIPTDDGNYACEVTAGSCVDTTICVFVEAVDPGIGISEQGKDVISVYPNPVSGELIVANTEISLMSIRIINSNGQEVYASPETKTDSIKVDMSAYSKGFYLVEISTSAGVYRKRIIKQ